MRASTISRIVGFIVFGIGGFYLEERVPNLIRELMSAELRLWLFPIAGGLIGITLAPYISIRPARTLRKLLVQTSGQVLLAGLIGMIVGLLVAALFVSPLSTLPEPLNQILPSAGAVLCGWLGITIFVARRVEILGVLHLRPRESSKTKIVASDNGHRVLLDTSVIIDGRVVDISKTGFVHGTMVVPKFVLNELQHIADSAETLRRNRGRRGLEMLNRLKNEKVVPVQVTDMDVENVSEVDDKLVILAKRLDCPVMTNDYNLNKVAQLQGVNVLNINDLANAIKTCFLPGENMKVQIIQEGKESGQGVGYLEDGTMVVIDSGKKHMKRTINVVVTKALQTAAGRMIFAKPE